MKNKIVIGFMGLVMSLGIGIQAFAQSSTYEIKEADMKINIPEEYMVFQNIVDEFDPNLEMINSTKAELEAVFKQGNIYLNAVMVPPETEIVVTVKEYIGSQEIFNFNSFTEKELNELGNKLINEAGNSEVEYTTYETYSINGCDFLVFDIIQNSSAGEVYGKQYHTIVNGQAIYITLHSYVGEVSENYSDRLKTIVDSIKFGEIKPKPSEGFMTELMNKITIKTIVGAGAVVVILGVTLIIVALRSGKDDEEDEEDDEYEDEDEEYDVDKEIEKELASKDEYYVKYESLYPKSVEENDEKKEKLDNTIIQ